MWTGTRTCANATGRTQFIRFRGAAASVERSVFPNGSKFCSQGWFIRPRRKSCGPEQEPARTPPAGLSLSAFAPRRKATLPTGQPGKPSAPLAQWIGASLAAQRREIESRLHNRRARHFDALQIARRSEERRVGK